MRGKGERMSLYECCYVVKQRICSMPQRPPRYCCAFCWTGRRPNDISGGIIFPHIIIPYIYCTGPGKWCLDVHPRGSACWREELR